MTRIENKSENRKRRFKEHFAKIAVKTSKGRTNKKNKSPSGVIGKGGGAK
jgi:hypothetical protein